MSDNNNFDLLIEKLAQEFDCKHIGFYPFPSITPGLMQGFRVECQKFNKDINSTQECDNCEYKEI